jgi:hypothetical protein
MTRVTDALQMVLLGLECLENFDTTLRLTFPVIEKATAYTQTNLSKVYKNAPLILQITLALTKADSRDGSIGKKS